MAVKGKLFYLLVRKLPRFESEHRRLTTKKIKKTLQGCSHLALFGLSLDNLW